MCKRLEYLLAFTALFWGLWLLSPFWDVFTSSPAFGAMGQIAPENVWGLAAACIGIVQIYVVRSGTKFYRRAAVVGGLFTWVILAAFFYTGNPHGTAFIPYAALGIAALIAFIEIGQ